MSLTSRPPTCPSPIRDNIAFVAKIAAQRPRSRLVARRLGLGSVRLRNTSGIPLGHCPAKHTRVVLVISCIESSHRLVPEQSFISNALTLPHAVSGDIEVDFIVDTYEFGPPSVLDQARGFHVPIADFD